jgi:hypothetical protein
MTAPSEPWKPQDDATLWEAIGQAVGAASMCWEHPGGAGVFDADKALWVAQGLERWLREHAYVHGD